MTQTETTRPNRLILETSPYLLQHAHNPVDWYPWGQEAFDRARAEDKPVLLSVGYSACHWCHVMAHESFEDADTAKLMNELFINIKVDREERPDVDGIYMAAVQAMTGRGGWPMTVFLTPDGKPFYGGTYFPPAPRYGMPGFRQVLQAISDAWLERRTELESAGERLAEALHRAARYSSQGGALTSELCDIAARTLLRNLDRVEGGFGGAPKFPQPMILSFLLQHYAHAREQPVLDAVVLTLKKMARGGMYDQLGGGFHRYSTDDRWLVPHFEKMLYDTAQLARLYLSAWQVTSDPEFRRVAEESLDYVAREMTDPLGGFYSSQDADSEGEEGKFFVWTPDELVEVLGADDARLVGLYYDVTMAGNFEGKNVLHVEHALEPVAEKAGVTVEQLRTVLERSRAKLFAARERRVKPGRDHKILVEWNGLMLRTLAHAAAVLGRDDYRRLAERNAEFLLRELCQDDGGLLRTWSPGSVSGAVTQARITGYLEDYANLIDGLIELYEVTFDVQNLVRARHLTEIMIEHFWDRSDGGFFQTSDAHDGLIVRPKEFVDNAVPSGNSVAADVLQRLSVLTGEAGYRAYAEKILLMMREAMVQQPQGFGRLLGALERYLAPPQEVALIGNPDDERTQALLSVVRSLYLPSTAVALAASPAAAQLVAAEVPLLAGRDQVAGQPTAYVCENFACRLPVTEPGALANALAG